MTDTWITRAGIPVTVANGGSLAYPGSGDTLYALGGNGGAFWAYTLPVYAGPKWYVNDAYTAADSYTYAGGSDTSGDGSRQKPWRSLVKVMEKVKTGDTIWLDAGTYGSDTWEMISATETAAVNLDTDNLTLIGVDSNAAVIDPPWAVVIKITHLPIDFQARAEDNEELDNVRGVTRL